MRTLATTLAAALICLLGVLTPANVWANGDNSHIWITLEARALLPEGELKQLLSQDDTQLMLQNGASFPDGGYVVGDDYGEIAHWEPFVIAYLDWIRAHYDRPYLEDPGARAHVAFLMGIVSHGIADQVYDAMFMATAHQYDVAGWSDDTLDSFDTATDVLLVVATGQNIDPEPWVPSEELSQLYADALGYDVAPGTLDNAQNFLRAVVSYPREAAQDPARVAEYRARYPWAAAHMMDSGVPGGPRCEAAVVAAYQQAIWDRLHGEQSLENLVIATVPPQSTDAALVESQVVLVFGHAIDDTSLGPDAIIVTDALERRLAIDVSPWRTQSNVVRLRPHADWPADSILTVTLAPGVRTIDGMTLDAPWSFHVMTAPPATSTTPCFDDPTPNTAPPETGAIGAGGGGCMAGTRGHPPAWAWPVIAVLVVVLRRRSRTAG